MLERFEGKQENFKYLKLTEEQQKKRGILGRLVGVIADTKNSTRNERLYSKELWESVFDNPIMQEKIKNKVVYGQLGHPINDEDLTADGIEKVAVALAEKPKIGSDGKIYGVFDILNTPNGRILKTLCDYGSTLGISSRGDGEVIETENGSEVDPESYNCICWDVVLVPGVKDARLKYMTESLQTKKEERMKKKLNETLNKANEDDRKVMTETLHNLNITIDTENEEQPKVSVSVDDKEPVEISGAEEQPIEGPETEETPVEEPVEEEKLEEASSSFKKAFKNGGQDAADYLDGKAISRIKDPKARDAAIAAKKAGRDDVVKAFTGDRKQNQAERDYEKKAMSAQKSGYTGGEDEINPPTSFTIPLELVFDEPSEYNDEDLSEAINDYISDETGWLVNNYNYEVDGDFVYITNIDYDMSESFKKPVKEPENEESLEDITNKYFQKILDGAVDDIKDLRKQGYTDNDIKKLAKQYAEEEITESLNEKDEAEEKSEEEIKDAMTQICDSSIIGELLKHYIDLNTTIKSNILGNDSISEETKEIIKNVNDEVAKSIEALQNGLVEVNNKPIEDNAEEEVVEPDDVVLDDIDKESSEETPENEPEEVTNSESDEVVESFKETLKENANLIKEVKSLNEKLAVRNSEADKLNEELDLKKKLIESLNNKLKSNSKEVSTLKEQLEVRDIKVKRFKKLYEDAQANSAKTATSLNESLEKGSKDTINRLNEKDTQIKKLSESLNFINSKYEKETTNLNAQVKTLKESYIKARAKVLGVPAERIIKYLPENYSIQDIDTTCEKIEDDNLRLSNLPFGIARGTKVSTGSAINSQETSIADDFVADLLHY